MMAEDEDVSMIGDSSPSPYDPSCYQQLVLVSLIQSYMAHGLRERFWKVISVAYRNVFSDDDSRDHSSPSQIQNLAQDIVNVNFDSDDSAAIQEGLQAAFNALCQTRIAELEHQESALSILVASSALLSEPSSKTPAALRSPSDVDMESSSPGPSGTSSTTTTEPPSRMEPSVPVPESPVRPGKRKARPPPSPPTQTGPDATTDEYWQAAAVDVEASADTLWPTHLTMHQLVSVLDAGDAKDARIDTSQAGVMSEYVMSQMQMILTHLSRDKETAQLFLNPVNQTALPDYSSFILHALCYKDLEKRLEDGEYRETLPFLRDLLQIFGNCIVFNFGFTELGGAASQARRLALYSMAKFWCD